MLAKNKPVPSSALLRLIINEGLRTILVLVAINRP